MNANNMNLSIDYHGAKRTSLCMLASAEQDVCECVSECTVSTLFRSRLHKQYPVGTANENGDTLIPMFAKPNLIANMSSNQSVCTCTEIGYSQFMFNAHVHVFLTDAHSRDENTRVRICATKMHTITHVKHTFEHCNVRLNWIRSN